MKIKSILIVAAAAGLLGGCAATAPNELVNARQAYLHASTGPAAQTAPAELHTAKQALALAEQSFKKDSDSYLTRDLAYAAQRKSELAEARAAIVVEQRSQAQAGKDYQTAQGNIIADTKDDLSRSREALAVSESSGALIQERLYSEQDARTAADQQTADAQAALAASRASVEMSAEQLAAEKAARAASEQASRAAADKQTADAVAAKAASDQRGKVAAEQLAAEQAARAAADKRAAESQAALASLAAVKEEPRGIVITLSGSVLFASDQSVLLKSAQARLNKVTDVLLTTPERNLIIEGYADSRGTDSYNIDLSQRRADAVRSYLVNRGYRADRIQANGLGEAHPVASNESAEGRANNRRVEIVIQRDQASNK
ncbi:MAG: OmpA family protein [Deltaproteobacteria bacterium]|nr:OmpA family protein [Deltaproteobacteria bacterium]